MLEAIKYKNGKLEILDQLKLPGEVKYIKIKGVEDGWTCINKMQVRGAPAIAIVGSLSLVVEMWNEMFTDKKQFLSEIEGKLNYLISSRPTAVNMKLAADDLLELANCLCSDENYSAQQMKEKFVQTIEGMLDKDIADNDALSKYGAADILFGHPGDSLVNVLTHCNTGSLATAGYGTALGVIRKLFEFNRLERVYCTETRPYNQGSRLTAFELVHDKIPATLLVDSAVAHLFKSKKIDAVVVGADRVASNGDTANKIGTYQIACIASLHNVPFYVCAPFTSIDFKIPNGDQITIEERPESEMTYVAGHRVAAPGISCFNPAFDITPANLIKGIITERGVFKPKELQDN